MPNPISFFFQNFYMVPSLLLLNVVAMFRFEHDRKQFAAWDFRVGILFDVIYKDISEEDYNRFSEAKVQDNVKAVQEAIMKLRWSCHLLPVKDDVKTLINLLELFRPD
ncbi:MAG: hypothetical protein QXZ70_09005, partial [Candidatus Bathyarchaeia archaeon]